VSRAANEIAMLFRQETPTDEDWALRATLAKAQGRTDDAIALLERVSDRSRFGPDARLRQGQYSRQLNRIRSAEGFLIRATELDPKMILPRVELIYIYAMQFRRKPISQQFLALARLKRLEFNDIYVWCRTRRPDWDPLATSKTLRAWLDAEPEDRQSRLALAEMLRLMARYDEARSLLEPLPDRDPEALAARARIALARGDDEGAEAILAKGPPDHPSLAKLRGRFALLRGDYPKAAAQYRIAVNDDAQDHDAVFGLGHSLASLGEPKRAEPFLERARKLDALNGLVAQAADSSRSADSQLISALGEACKSVGRYAEARAWYQLLIARDPLDNDAQRALFQVDEALRKTGSASEDRPL
jgi:tetratricopeptide (TPR) repeat protein